MPKISVIVPVYNVEAYLCRCIDSILSQTFSDFELILVDDGAKDASGRICDDYAAKDSRIVVVHKENAGVSAARNTGLDIANGEYVMFVDSDDHIAQNTLEQMLILMTKDVDLVVSSVVMVTKTYTQSYQMPSKIYKAAELLQDFSKELFPRMCVCGPCAKLYRKNMADRFDEAMSLGEDTCFNMAYLKKCEKIATTEQKFYYYMRENEESLFTKFQSNTYEQQKMVYLRMQETINAVGAEDAIDELIRVYVSDLVGNIVKAVATAKKQTCIHYMRSVATDEMFLANPSAYQRNRRMSIVGKLIKKHYYHLCYLLCYGWMKIRKWKET